MYPAHGQNRTGLPARPRTPNKILLSRVRSPRPNSDEKHARSIASCGRSLVVEIILHATSCSLKIYILVRWPVLSRYPHPYRSDSIGPLCKAVDEPDPGLTHAPSFADVCPYGRELVRDTIVQRMQRQDSKARTLCLHDLNIPVVLATNSILQCSVEQPRKVQMPHHHSMVWLSPT